jgi:acyl-CoA thioester hydrolase
VSQPGPRQPDWDYPEPFLMPQRVSRQDIDGLEHTNNAVYVNWCEQAAWAHSISLGLDLDRYQALDRAMAVTHAEYDYLQATREGDEVLVATWISAWDRRLSMDRTFQILRPADGVTVLRGTVRFVCIEISSGRPRRMPAAFVEGYGPAVLAGTE